jgi:hypothetical protein
VGELDPEDSIRAMKRLEYIPAKEEVYKTASVYGLKWRTVILLPLPIRAAELRFKSP